MSKNIEIVEELSSGLFIVKIEEQVSSLGIEFVNTITKYALANENGIIDVVDANGNLSVVRFFDSYKLNENDDIIIGIEKDSKEYCERVLSKFYIDSHDAVFRGYNFNYGLINREGVLILYPAYDFMDFGNENTCIVGMVSTATSLRKGYVDSITGKAITPICFAEGSKFYDNRAAVKYWNKCGYIDRNKIMNDPKKPEEYAENLSPMFYRANDFHNGEATAVLFEFDDKYARLDKSGIVSFEKFKKYRKG